MAKVINVFTDGGSRGNPGEGAIGVYIENEHKKQLIGFGKKIGICTNNVAEYKAVLEAFLWLDNNKQNLPSDTSIFFFIDSRLIYSQLIGVFKIKDSNLKNYFFLIKEKERTLGFPIKYNNIPRELNKKADSLVNQALDNII